MRRTILIPLSLVFVLAGCGDRSSQEGVRIKGDPGNTDSPIVVADSSVGTQGWPSAAGTKPSGYGHIQHPTYTLNGALILIEDYTGSFIHTDYKATSLTIEGNDAQGNPVKKAVKLTDYSNWTLMINGAYKVYSADEHTITIDPMQTTMGLLYDSAGKSWDMSNAAGLFNTVTISTFGNAPIYNSNTDPHPAPGYWKITLHYCKGGVQPPNT